MDYEDDIWVPKVGFVNCFERMLFVRMVNGVLDAIDKELKFPSMHSESLPAGERLSEKIDDHRNEKVFRFVGRRFRLSYEYCYKTSSRIKLCELIADNFETQVSSMKIDRSDDVYDKPRISPEEDCKDVVQLFATCWRNDFHAMRRIVTCHSYYPPHRTLPEHKHSVTPSD
jgi:hypothetical protein